jgi:hypothetical protein
MMLSQPGKTSHMSELLKTNIPCNLCSPYLIHTFITDDLQMAGKAQICAYIHFYYDNIHKYISTFVVAIVWYSEIMKT